MTKESLGYIKNLLINNGINYEFMEWTGDPQYPYFVGEYQEDPSMNEDGIQESTFILTGFNRGKWLDLENAKKTIKKITNITDILPHGNGISILYRNSSVIPTGEANFQHIEIQLEIKELEV